jgi:hypothetical protein
MNRPTFILMLIAFFSFILVLPYANAAKVKAEDVDKFDALSRNNLIIKIDADLADWALHDEILFMGEKTWEPNGAGKWQGDDDISAELRVLYDEDNLYFGLIVRDSEYVAQGANPWDNDGVQIAIDSSAGKIPVGWPNQTTHLYNFSIANGWLKETGPFLGDAEIQMKRDEIGKKNIFEWRMPTDIFAKKGTKLKAGVEIAYAMIVNDSDKDAPGQAGWVGWGNHALVNGKKPQEMKTLVLSSKTASVEPKSKLTATWGTIKKTEN